MLYLIDCDGVLADFTRHVLNLTGSDLSPEAVATYDIFEVVGKEHEDFLLQDPEFWRTLPVVEGAQAGLEAIRQEPGAEIVIVTSPWWSCKGWLAARLEWLGTHFQIEPRDVIAAKRKELIRGDCLIDDRYENVAAWAEAWPEGAPYLYDQPYNRHEAVPPEARISWAGQGPVAGTVQAPEAQAPLGV